MPRRRLRRSRRQLFSIRTWRTRLSFWAGAILVGLSATALALGSEYAGQAFRWLTEDRPYLPLLLTPLGLVAITYLTLRFFPGSQGSGIPQAIAALGKQEDAVRHSVLSIRIAIGKSLMVVLGVLCGASIGREGPTVHVAASIMYSLRRFARFPHHDVTRGLILAGAAAGLAAAFNTPLAGVVFAIEEMSRSFEERTSGTVITAVIIAGMIALSIQGNYSYFGVVAAYVDATAVASAALAVLVCGVLGGALGGAFSRFLVRGGKRLAPWSTAHPLVVAGLCGLGVALLGLVSGGSVYGTGYEEARALLAGEDSAGAAYPFLKLLATLVSYWSGIPGGIFAPSLSVGAGLGADLAPLFPALAVATVMLLGMVAYFAGVVQTPITAVVIVIEMTDDHSMLLPLMATALIANGVSRYICLKPIYRALSDQFLHAVHAVTRRE